MDTTPPDLTELFAQLGLPGDEKNIARFIETHALPPEQALAKAAWWNPAQAAFLQEALENDSDWALIVDLLANLLRRDHSS